jgi:hypothetical protein
LTPEKSCKDYTERQKPKKLNECLAEKLVKDLDDIQSGLTYFTKRIDALSCAVKTGKTSDTYSFIPQIEPLTESATFNDLFDNGI